MSRTILVVDDSPFDRARLEALLASAGYQTASASDGAQAVELARRSKPYAILMDVNMPKMDGYAATRALKADAGTKDIPVVLVTVKGQKADRAWAQMLGATAHISKPYSDAEMLEYVRAL